jgi:hypothetical protein
MELELFSSCPLGELPHIVTEIRPHSFQARLYVTQTPGKKTHARFDTASKILLFTYFSLDS